ncbi:hypothetical protein QL285_074801 [Trifolium repens]|nr:hypothetical protein QL285_074801 [Trifolium repens]
MTKTCPNTKENLQKQEKASRQGPRCQKIRKSPKSEEIEHSIAARNFHRATMEAACSPRKQKNKSEENLFIAARYSTSQHDDITWRPS